MGATEDSDLEVEVEEPTNTPKSKKGLKKADRPGPKSRKSGGKTPIKESKSSGKKRERSIIEGMRKSGRGGKPIERFEAPSIEPLKSRGSRGKGSGKGKSYTVEKVLGKRTSKSGGVKYLLKWQGYPRSQATWESANSGNFDHLIDKYEEENGSKNKKQSWEVEKILEKRVSKGKTEYLLKWKNFPVNEATWQTARSGNFKDLINKFEGGVEEDEEEYVVEKILGKRMKGGKAEYLLKWKGYSRAESTWESADDGNFEELISEFEEEEGKGRSGKTISSSTANKGTKRKSSAVNGGPKKKSKKGNAKPKSKKGRSKKSKAKEVDENDPQEEEEEQSEEVTDNDTDAD